MLLILLSLLLKQGIASCIELTEVSSKKNSIFTFTSKVNNYFPEDYEYCIKISNKSAAIFMNNAIASVTVSTGIGSSKNSIKLKEKNKVGYYFLQSEQENVINFKIKKALSSFSVSFVSFPDECDIKIVSNIPEKVISAKDYANQNKKKYNHVCYFSGFPFGAQFSYDEIIEKKYSLKISSRSKVLIEQKIINVSQNDNSRENIVKIAKVATPSLLEWDISNDELDFFQVQISKNDNYTGNNRIDRNFNRKTKIHQILNNGNRTIIGHISYTFDKALLMTIIAIMACTFVFVLIITVFVLHRKGICCVKQIIDTEHDSDDWEVNIDQDDNKIIFRKPYLVENFENPYESGKEVVNIIKKEPKHLSISSVLNFKDSITEQLIPDSA